MSKKATIWAWKMADTIEDLSASAVLVLAALAHFHNQETGRCNPSVARIARRTHLSQNTVRSAIKALVRANLVRVYESKVRHKAGKTNLPNNYVLTGGGTATIAGGVLQQLHPKESYKSASQKPAAFYDLANLLDPED